MTDPFAVVSAFLMHSGSRHLTIDLTQAQKQLLSQPITKFVILYAMFYISTRNLFWATVLIIIYIFGTKILLNENHRFNIYSHNWLATNGLLNSSIHPDDSYISIYKKNIQALKQ